MMRRVAAALLLICAVTSAVAQSAQEQQRNADRIVFPAGETEIVISDASKIPRQLQAALARDPCGHESWLNHLPIRIVKLPRPGYVAALVPCGRITATSRAYLFDRWWKEPRAMSFPVIAFPTGFGATRSPGYLEWDARSMTLTALQGTDVCHADIARYTYRYGENQDREDGMSWVLLKAERGVLPCGGDTVWRAYWEASEWKERLAPR